MTFIVIPDVIDDVLDAAAMKDVKGKPDDSSSLTDVGVVVVFVVVVAIVVADVVIDDDDLDPGSN